MKGAALCLSLQSQIDDILSWASAWPKSPSGAARVKNGRRRPLLSKHLNECAFEVMDASCFCARLIAAAIKGVTIKNGNFISQACLVLHFQPFVVSM